MPDRAGRDALDRLQSSLREVWPEREDGWTSGDDFHLTLRFLGDLDADRLQAALAALSLAAPTPALEVTFTGIELWPSRRPRLAVARFAADPRLAEWVATLERWAVDHGLPAEPRAHLPHVTLLRSPKPLDAQPPALSSWRLRLSGLQAMHRSLQDRGPRYQAHAEYRLD